MAINITCVNDSDDDEQEFQWDNNDLASTISTRPNRTLTTTTYVSKDEEIPMATLSTKPEVDADASEETSVKVFADVHSPKETPSASMTDCDVEASNIKTKACAPVSGADASPERDDVARGAAAALALDVEATSEETGGEIIPFDEISGPSVTSSAKNTSNEVSPSTSWRPTRGRSVAGCEANARSTTSHEIGACANAIESSSESDEKGGVNAGS